MIIVGICGASGSGKSTLAKEIEDSLTCTSAIIGLDCYAITGTIPTCPLRSGYI